MCIHLGIKRTTTRGAPPCGYLVCDSAFGPKIQLMCTVPFEFSSGSTDVSHFNKTSNLPEEIRFFAAGCEGLLCVAVVKTILSRTERKQLVHCSQSRSN